MGLNPFPGIVYFIIYYIRKNSAVKASEAGLMITKALSAVFSDGYLI